MTGIVAHTYPEWWLKLAGQVAHWSTDYSYQPSVIKFESENSAQLADRLEQIITGKIIINEQDLRKARSFVLKNYTADAWAEKLIQYYNTLCEGKTDESRD